MIYIQSDNEKTRPHHFDCSCALFGAIDSSMEYRLTSFDEVASGKFDALIKKRLFVGSTEFMREVFKRAGIVEVPNTYSTIGLPRNSNREYEVITLAEAQERVLKQKTQIFIKPMEVKLFTGLVLDGAVYSCLTGLPGDTKVMAYKTFESKIETEWRIYVHNHEMVDARNYSGDFTMSPDYDYVKKVIKENEKDFPCAYTLDVGVLESGENVVIEFNDMWAIGNYGMPNDIYLRLLKDRYFEIMNQHKMMLELGFEEDPTKIAR